MQCVSNARAMGGAMSHPCSSVLTLTTARPVPTTLKSTRVRFVGLTKGQRPANKKSSLIQPNAAPSRVSDAGTIPQPLAPATNPKGPVILTPPRDAGGAVIVKPRLDVAEIDTNPALSKQRDLLILGFERLMYGADDGAPTNPRSFFQIGGIHGWPFVPYDSDGPVNGPPVGYCWHGSQLFPTWHRPYVALLEQEFVRCATAVAATYTGPDAQAYADAAAELRLPYWNWLSNNAAAPKIITDAQVQVTGPTGKRTLDNPLAAFKFPVPPLGAGYSQLPSSSNPGFPPPATPKTFSLRHPRDGAGAVDAMNTALGSLFTQQVRNWRVMLGYAYKPEEWKYFADHSETRGNPNPIFQTSLESIHDNIHVEVGGTKGHMAYPEVAGLDPIFFLHHCQIDRLLAQWQVAHPTVFVQNGVDSIGGGTYLVEADTVLDGPDYELHPFRKSPGAFWTSNDVKNVKSLGYSYDVTTSPAAAAVSSAVKKAAALTPQPAPAGVISTRSIPNELISNAAPAPAAPQPAPAATKAFKDAKAAVQTAAIQYRQQALADLETDDGFGFRWTLSLPGIDKYQFGGPFTVNVYFKPADSKEAGDKIFAGSVGVFTRSRESAEFCENCKKQSSLVGGLVDVTEALTTAGLVGSATKADAQLSAWRDFLVIEAVDCEGVTHNAVEVGAAALNSIVEEAAGGISFFNADDPPVSAAS